MKGEGCKVRGEGGSLGLGVELSSGRRDGNEQILLDVVDQEVRDRINQSLHHTILMTLGKSDSSLPVHLPRQGKLRLPDGSQHPFASEASICDLFDHPAVMGRLLIMGSAGIGKTTALLELAAELIQRATHDPEQPMPVLFHLSSWTVEQQSFEDWLRMELRLKYGVSKKLSNQWLEANILLPLLDGLDKLHPDHQAAAVQNINEWLGNVSGPLVVSCCGTPYDLYPTNLALNGTLDLEPLTPGQLEQYLTSLGLDDLWMRIRKSPEHLDLLRTPLWLSLLILAKDTFDSGTWERLNSLQERQHFLLDGFILQQLHQPLSQPERANENPPTAQQMRHWLGWLARHIRDQTEHEFLIEKMQPTLLSNRRQVSLYSLLGGLIFGATGGMIFGLFVGPFSGVFVTCIVTFMFIFRRRKDAIATVEEFKPSLSNFVKFVSVRQIGPFLFFTAFVGLIIFVTVGDPGMLMVSLLIGLIVSLSIRFIFAFPSWLIGGLVIGINHLLDADITVQNQPNQYLFATARYALRMAAMFVPFLLAIKTLPLYWGGFSIDQTVVHAATIAKVLGVGAALALWASIFDSALVCAQHLALRLVLFKARAIPWNYARFLNGCCDRHLLQRVGGRYQFIHHLVQKRFAEM